MTDSNPRHEQAGLLDAHIHLFEQGWGGKGPADADLTAYLELRRRYGIDRALVVGYEGEVSYAGRVWEAGSGWRTEHKDSGTTDVRIRLAH